MTYIDLHCDALLHFFLSDDFDLFSSEKSSVDLDRLHRAGAMAQCFAIYQPTVEELAVKNMPEKEYILYIYQKFHKSLAEHRDMAAPAVNAEEIVKNYREGKLSAVLTLEDGRSVNGEFNKLIAYRNLGIRMLTLTWYQENCFGSPSSDDRGVMASGLSKFGRDSVSLMNELGIIIDASHLSDGGFWDLIELSAKPFIASHSNCRALVPHYRNLSDEMIRALSEKGGVMGLNFCHFFLKDAEEKKNIGGDVINKILFQHKKTNWYSRVKDMVRHVHHAYNAGGENILAIGTDFDGIPAENLEIDSPLKMDLLFAALKESGLPNSAIDKMMFKNALRVFADTDITFQNRTGNSEVMITDGYII